MIKPLRWLESHKDLIGSISSIITSCAIIIGGFWTYQTFFSQRTLASRAKLTQRVFHLSLNNDSVLVHTTVLVENPGNGELFALHGSTVLRCVLPATGNRVEKVDNHFAWPVLDSCEYFPEGTVIEPKEIENWDADFIVPAETSVIEVTSRMTLDPTDTTFAWSDVMYYSLDSTHRLNSKDDYR